MRGFPKTLKMDAIWKTDVFDISKRSLKSLASYQVTSALCQTEQHWYCDRGRVHAASGFVNPHRSGAGIITLVSSSLLDSQLRALRRETGGSHPDLVRNPRLTPLPHNFSAVFRQPNRVPTTKQKSKINFCYKIF